MKKAIALIMALLLAVAMAVSAFGVYADELVNPILFKTANGTPTIDGVMDEAYTQSDLIPVVHAGADVVIPEGHATANAYTLWDDQYIYVYVDVTDNTPSDPCPSPDKSWNYDSVEVYVDYANDKYDVEDMLVSEYAAQIRLQRHAESNGGFGTEGGAHEYIDSGIVLVQVEREDGTGYVIEAAIPHNNMLSSIIGFAMQINDDMNNDAKYDAAMYVRPLNCTAWGYTSVFDSLELVGCTATNGREDTSIEYDTPADLAAAEVRAPEAEAPVTDAPVTEPPVTEAPVTDAPETEAPVTDAPVTEAPETDAPADEPANAPADEPANAPADEPADEPADDTKAEPESDNNALLIGLAVAVVVVIAVVVVLVLKKKK